MSMSGDKTAETAVHIKFNFTDNLGLLEIIRCNWMMQRNDAVQFNEFHELIIK